ncbi:protein T24A6.7 [Hirsutella rhossiliensis]|uniref:Protein T24A6.7 n=1 Tax=Hirsutella rhossiliensis TaxID=111463 RepID=A0A9P8MVU5_9HYPO|nr:protein T24A6.7 [Hirsutella rhossiliensis]KAH0962175.1 protein T24A6.7 [Hirsutella rhossiliensis]
MTDPTKAHEPVYFWKDLDGETGWLCQWYYHPFRDDEVPERLYYTAEHYMMYQKAKLFGDDKTAAEILQTKPPGKAKALGRKVPNFNQATWEAKREDIVRKGNLLKFSTPPPPRMLLRTGDRELVKASPFDRVWGVGFRPEEAPANRGQWELNLLGKALTDVRAALWEQEEMR